jgi:hypothetical protein
MFILSLNTDFSEHHGDLDLKMGIFKDRLNFTQYLAGG